MKTQDEIVERCQALAADRTKDFFGFQAETMISYLDYERAKPDLVEGVTQESWDADGHKPLTREQVLADMAEYIAEFGWDKAESHRGLSAGRTMDRMCAWLWMLGDDETLAYVSSGEHYTNYGAPSLKKICEVYSLPIPDSEALRNMAEGKPCRPDCDGGCDMALRGSDHTTLSGDVTIGVRQVGGEGFFGPGA